MNKAKFYFKKSIVTLREEGYKGLVSKAKKKLSKDMTKNNLLVESLASVCDFTYEDLEKNRKLLEDFEKSTNVSVKTINWFVNYFEYPMGGVNNIFRFAEYFQEKYKVTNRFVFYDAIYSSRDELKDKLKKYFPGIADSDIYLPEDCLNNFKRVPESDASIATYWTSAFSLLKFNKTKAKYYFIQDWEPLFYSAGTEYALAEDTYRFRFMGICNTFGLYDEYIKYNPNSVNFTIAVDKEIYYPKPAMRPKDKFKIYFYTRPSTPRNAFDIGVFALKKVKSIYGDKFEVVASGEKSDMRDYGVSDLITNYGVMSIKDHADLYRTCHAGLVFMFTKHPSFQPLEYMAAGMVTVTNDNPANSWLLKDNENCLLAEASASCVAEKIIELIENEKLRNKIVNNGIETIKKLDWEEQIEKVWLFMNKKLPEESRKSYPRF